MAMIGDLVARAGMDTSGFTRGASEMKNALGSATAAGSGMARQNFNQASFAAQDFFSVLQMGGHNAVGRAFMSIGNNLQMLTAMLPGPIGMVAMFGTTLAAVLLPELLKSTAAGKDFKDSLEDIAKSADRMVSKGAAGIAFFRGVEDMDSGKQVADAQRKNAVEIEQLEQEKKDRLLARRQTIEEGIWAKVAKPTRGGDIGQFFGKDNTFLGGVGSDDPEFVKRVEDQRKAIDSVQDDIQRRKRRAGLLDDRLPGAKAAEQDKKDKADAARFEEDGKSSAEKLADRMRRIGEVARAGFLGPDAAGKVFDKSFNDFVKGERGHTVDRKIESNEAGTSQGFSAVMASIRQSQDKADTEQIRIARAALDEHKRALKYLQTIAQNSPREEGI